ncbi:MAG: tetratricopeptide repeat protein, partial [Limnothrix sp. CACIAM 69d]
MVSVAELLEKLNQATSTEERNWILLESRLARLPGDLATMVWAAAIPHFFDAAVLAALCPELADQASDLYGQLQTLEFVEEFVGHGHNIHELSRNILLDQLWKTDQERFLLYSRRMGDYFAGLDEVDAKIEMTYHRILADPNRWDYALDSVIVEWLNYRDLDKIEIALTRWQEHEQQQRLGRAGQLILQHYQGCVDYKKGNYADALVKLQQSVEAEEQFLAADHPQLAMHLQSLATVYGEQGRYKEAEPLFQRSLEIRERLLGVDHPDTATSLLSLANLYQAQGRYEAAEPLYRRSLEILEQGLGADHPDTANSLNNLALLYSSQGRYEAAEPLYRRSLEIYEQVLGADHPDTANSLNNLASLYQSQGRYEAAEPLYRRSLEIREQVLGADHPDTATSLNNLALLYKSQGRYEAAEPLYRRSLEIDEKVLEPSIPSRPPASTTWQYSTNP